MIEISKATLCKLTDNAIALQAPEKHISFLESVTRFYAKHKSLTPAQQQYVTNLYDKYSDEAKREEEAWKTDYDEDLKAIALKCAEYYEAEGSGYYKNIVAKVKADKHITKKEFTSMCMNKYHNS